MQAVLISIHPKWCELIASGKKTVEIRKTKPLIEAPFKCFIYETQDEHYKNMGYCFDAGKCFEHAIGKVIGEFVCTSVTEFSVPYPAYFDSMGYCVSRLLVDAQVTKSAAHHYLKQKNGYGWRITDLIIYDKPRELSEFSKYGFGHPVPLKRPPQSWMYVEVSDE